MDSFQICLPESGGNVVVSIERKKMKSSRLKVFPTMEVKISVPYGVSNGWIEKYLSEKACWIEEKLQKFKSTTGYASTSYIKNGMSIKIFGKDMIFSVHQSEKKYIYAENKLIHIGCSNIQDQDALMSVFEKWWRQKALECYKQYVDRLFPIVGKYNTAYPSLRVRKMKTLWGSYSLNTNTITINQYLLKARPSLIEYVILHELVHSIYPNHSKSFYDFLGTHMPDWKERKKVLDFEVVHGL